MCRPWRSFWSDATVTAVCAITTTSQTSIRFHRVNRTRALNANINFRPSQRYHFQLDGCIVRNAHNTVFDSKRYAICAQAVYVLHSTMPNVTCLRRVMSALSAVLLIYSLQFMSASLPCRSARPHRGVLGLPNIAHRTLPKISVGFLYRV